MTGGFEQELLERELESELENSFELEWESDREWSPEQEQESEGLLESPSARRRAGAQILRAAGTSTRQAPSSTQCPTPAQVARDRCIHPGTKTCPAIPDLLCLREISGLPFEYVVATGTDPTTRLKIISRRTVPVVQKFIPAVRDALTSFVGNMVRFGMPIEAILTLGSLYCRCVGNSDTLSNHSFGDAVDVVGVRWAAAGGPASRLKETVVYNWADAEQRALLRRINACLRLSFNTVIDYHRSDHRDHFHCDTNKNAGSVRAMGKSTTTPHFTQEALTLVLGRNIPITGLWDRTTMRGLSDFSGVSEQDLKNRQKLGEVLTQLFTRIASGGGASETGSMGLDQFPFDSSKLGPHQQKLVERIARRVADSWSSATPVRAIRVTGHTDSRGPAAYNQALGLRRASAVQAGLTRAIEKLRPGIAQGIRFVTQSMGAKQPVAPRVGPKRTARNRRVAVTLNPIPLGPGRLAEFLESEALLETPAATVTAPSLLYSESTVPLETHYVTIPLGGESPASPTTGIFVPSGYGNPSQLDLLVYLHGHHHDSPSPPAAPSPKLYPVNLTIDDYWKATRYKHFAFREGVNDSKKRVILVAPTLGPGSQGRRLDEPGGFDNYIDLVLAALWAYGPFKGQTERLPVGNIVLACHSGGGARMRSVASQSKKYARSINECWGFDCLYNKGDDTFWANRAKAYPSSKVYIHYGSGGTSDLSEKLRRLRVPNVFVEGSTSLPHNLVPMTHWRERLTKARFFIG